jgi:hypothetical protein
MSDLHYYHRDWIEPTSDIIDTDVCIYGGSSGGIAAAVTVARAGLGVVVLQPGKHIGGMTSGGLGWTDFGRKHVIGGLSRSFYNQVGGHYGLEEEWQFEPHVAEVVYNAWIAEEGIDVRYSQYLDTVASDDRRIVSISLLGGLQVKARLFMDCSYEGDLMAKAGVSFHVGREANEVYGETLNGIQVRDKHQFGLAVDPYANPGDPNSGLLPQVEEIDQSRRQGEGDHRVQAYCFRMCMTDDPALKIDWEKPAGFDPAQYALATRWFNTPGGDGQDPNHSADPVAHIRSNDVPGKFDILPNRTPGGFYKTDTNNHGAFSSDFIGRSWNWPGGGYEEREALFQAHVGYQRGLYWHLANAPALPQRVRNAYSRWGLSSDEFTDTEHWPHQLYIRECRRLIGDYVITEHDCYQNSVAEDSIGMGSYTMDSHNCSRFALIEGGAARVLNEGDVQIPPTDPYPISYRCIVPQKGQSANLFVPVCFSASHISYGSARMEPVFMVLGESAGLAAKLCLDDGCDVQDLPYDALRPELLSAAQVLELPDAR